MPELKFPLGQVVITASAKDRLHPEDHVKALARHASGDWGDASEADRRENDVSLAQGLRLFSVYHDRAGIEFWIISEADRSVTTILLPEDY